MNTTAFLHLLRRPMLVLAGAGLLGLPGDLSAQTDKAKEPTYKNYIDFSAGYNLQSGDRPGFQKGFQLNKDGFGGIEGLYLTKSLNDSTTMVLKGRALAGNNDYLLDVVITKDEVGYLKFGYKAFRTWYDGSGQFYPPNKLLVQLYDEDLHLDRGNLWFEAGYVPADKLNFVFRYDLFTRKGKKDTLSLGDSALAVSPVTVAPRGVLPAFRTIDEKRHVLKAKLSRQTAKTGWQIASTLDKAELANSYNVRRRFNEPASAATRNVSPDRLFTLKDGTETDLFALRGSVSTQINEKLAVNTAVSRTTIDTMLSGSRIVGNGPGGYDPVFDAVFTNRQSRDEGYLHLTGETQTKQTVATINALYRPTQFWSIIPAVRFEKRTTLSESDYEETNNPPSASNPTARLISEEIAVHSNNAWKLNSQSLDARYTGFKNWTVNFKADHEQNTGDIAEKQIVEPGTLNTIRIERVGDFAIGTQKYSATANWYPKGGMTVAVQYYFKARQSDFGATLDNIAVNTPTSGNRYPAYITNLDWETNDLNVRLSWKAANNLRLVTRYDYQGTTVRVQEAGLPFDEASERKSHIVAQTATWNPVPRWYLQGSVNVVFETMRTPAAKLTGNAAALVSNSDANYTNYSLNSGYALDEKSDLFVAYDYYNAENYIDTSARSLAYGTLVTRQQASVTLTRRLDPRTIVTLKYAYADNDDATQGGFANYTAHMLYGKVQYRF